MMTKQSLFMQIGNGLTKSLLRSPLHSVLSESTLAVTLTGRITGRTIVVPVNYVRQENTLIIVSQKDRTWWRNLIGGAPVIVTLQGVQQEGWADVFQEPTDVAAGITPYVKKFPQAAKYLHVRMDDQGNPNTADLTSIAPSRVVIKIKLS
jgi:hypothetical protein